MSSNPSTVIRAQQTPSKGPPPLPIAAPIAIASEGNALEAIFFEGIDGHAESVPSSDPDVASLSSADTCAPTALSDADCLVLEDEQEEEESVEDPARAQRRRIARIGVAWGAVAMAVLAAVALMNHPRAEERSVASAGPSHVEAVAPAPLLATTTPAATPSPPVVSAPKASVASAIRAAPRAVVRKGASPKASGARAKHALTHSTSPTTRSPAR